MLAYFCSTTIGTGTDSDPYRPALADFPDVEAWAACYEQSKEERAIVLVKAPEPVLDALSVDHERLYLASEVGLDV